MSNQIELTAQEISRRSLEMSVGLQRMLTDKELGEQVPISSRHRDRLIEKGEFPAPIYISPNRRVWFEQDIIAWQRERAAIGQRKRSFSPNPRKKKAA